MYQPYKNGAIHKGSGRYGTFLVYMRWSYDDDTGCYSMCIKKCITLRKTLSCLKVSPVVSIYEKEADFYYVHPNIILIALDSLINPHVYQ